MTKQSHIEQLIHDLCPNGVEYTTLKEACRSIAAPKKLAKKDYQEEGLYPIVDQGKKFIVGYTDDESALVPKAEYVIFGDHTREVKFVDFAFAQGADGLKILVAKQDFLPKYLYYCLQNLSVPSRGYNRHWSIACELEVPKPPKPIQEEIIRILDTFAELIQNIDKEIAERQQQYSVANTHYLNSKNQDWKKDTFHNLGKFYSGLSGKSKEDFSDGNAKFVTYKNVYFNPAIDLNISDKVKVSSEENQNYIQFGDVLFTGSSETPDECAISSVVNKQVKEKIYLNSFCFGFRFNDLSGIFIDFYKHYFRSAEMRVYALKVSHGTTRFNVSKEEFEQIPIPLPSLKDQQAIAAKLDTIEAFIANLQEERALRQQQYEYYRAKLISLLK